MGPKPRQKVDKKYFEVHVYGGL
eukprot:SAG31_NODE_39612_length_287_cov_0.606383_1_plen_22_part_01